MVGIIIASHGEFSKGILQSGEMIFGKQENVAAVTLLPNEGPDDVRKKMEDAINSFENQKEVLFLVDLWGGTPFNQVNALLDGHKDTWAAVAGLNLPMLIEAFSERFSSESAHEIASNILQSAREGVKVTPEELDKKKVEVKKGTKGASKGSIPEGTVIGTGKIDIGLARIDTRLLHGQVATSWSKTIKPTRIIVVSDNVAKDNLRKSMITEAAPPGVKANVIPLKKMVEIAKDPRFGNTRALLLFENPQDALKVIEEGVNIKELNLGSMAHSKGKVVLNTAISMDKNDVETYDKLLKLGVKIDVRKVPTDSSENFDRLLEKAKKELS